MAEELTDEELTKQLRVAVEPLQEAVAAARKAGLKVILHRPVNSLPDATMVLTEQLYFDTYRKTQIK